MKYSIHYREPLTQNCSSGLALHEIVANAWVESVTRFQVYLTYSLQLTCCVSEILVETIIRLAQ